MLTNFSVKTLKIVQKLDIYNEKCSPVVKRSLKCCLSFHEMRAWSRVVADVKNIERMRKMKGATTVKETWPPFSTKLSEEWNSEIWNQNAVKAAKRNHFMTILLECYHE